MPFPAKKLRKDSRLHKLTVEERAELDNLLIAGKLTLDEGVAWLAAHGVTLTEQSLSDYYRLHVLPRYHAHMDSVARVLNGISTENVTEGAHRAVAQRVFELATDPQAEPKLLIEFYKLLLKAASNDQSDRKLAMMEERERAAMAALSTPEEEETPEQQLAKVKGIFGMQQ